MPATILSPILLGSPETCANADDQRKLLTKLSQYADALAREIETDGRGFVNKYIGDAALPFSPIGVRIQISFFVP
ncbi:MAG: hypothetical protein MZV64_34760 [Ignavibacteriales bacterium]|nr:hypothetical protein [Ignavibacteriales bacterium]